MFSHTPACPTLSTRTSCQAETGDFGGSSLSVSSKVVSDWRLLIIQASVACHAVLRLAASVRLLIIQASATCHAVLRLAAHTGVHHANLVLCKSGAELNV